MRESIAVCKLPRRPNPVEHLPRVRTPVGFLKASILLYSIVNKCLILLLFAVAVTANAFSVATAADMAAVVTVVIEDQLGN